MELQSAGFEPAPPERLEPKSNALDHSAKTAIHNQACRNFVYINLTDALIKIQCKIVTFSDSVLPLSEISVVSFTGTFSECPSTDF